MTTKELFDKILEWEHEAGESFTDYFMHDSVNFGSWAFWLLGKGFNDHANIIIDILATGETYVGQEELFEIHSEYDENQKWSRDEYEKNVMIWAEFLVSTKIYLTRVTEFFNNKD